MVNKLLLLLLVLAVQYASTDADALRLRMDRKGKTINKKSNHFKTRPHTFSLGVAPTARAQCRACKRLVEKGEPRLVTHAFVKPGRSHDFVQHVACVSGKVLESVFTAHGSVENIPVERGYAAPSAAALAAARSQLNARRSLLDVGEDEPTTVPESSGSTQSQSILSSWLKVLD